jgi:hypothetical protein
MQSLQNFITETMNDPLLEVTYFSVGSSLKSYDYSIINPLNNQQYPIFLNKFQGKKLIVLVDPLLENKLAIEQLFEDLNDPLVRNNNIEYIKRNNLLVLQNDRITVIALREYFNYEEDEEHKLNNCEYFHHSYLDTIIELTLNNSKKLIVQDFTGRSIVTHYCDLLHKYERQNVLNNILYDVSNNYDGQCYFEFSMEQALIINNCFLQPLFMQVRDLHNDQNHVYKQKKLRIEMILLLTSSSVYNNKVNQNKLKYLSNLYNTNDMNQILLAFINDVAMNEDLEKEIVSNIMNRSKMISLLNSLIYI